jgi:hypothetical protein
MPTIIWTHALGSKLKILTDHKNLVKDALDLTCGSVYRYCLILEEYNSNIFYIKGTNNIVADNISHLDYNVWYWEYS